MFSGIIEEMGVVKSMTRQEGWIRLALYAEKVWRDCRKGDSLSVNGVCLSVTEVSEGRIGFDVMEETLARTDLGLLKNGEAVNLERALKAGERISGHFVTGHVDCLGKISAFVKRPARYVLEVTCPRDTKPYIAEKGSVAVSGVSLTVVRAESGRFSVHLVPQTLRTTSLAAKRPGEKVNVEFDIMTKYAALHSIKQRGIDESFLEEHGFK